MAVREVGATFTADATQFKAEMKAVDSNLALLSKELKATEAEFKAGGDASDYLASKQALLGQQVSQAAVKVDALQSAYDEVSGTLPGLATRASEAAAKFGENSTQAAEAAKAYKDAQTKADSLGKQLATARAQYANASAAFQENSAAMAENSEAAKEAAALTEKLEQAQAKLASTARGALAGGLKLAGDGTVALFKGVGALTAGAVTAAGALGTLAIAGLKVVAGYALEAAESGGKFGKAYRQFGKDLAALEKASAGAKAALGGMLLPVLDSLSKDGAQYLNDFTKAMNKAAGDPAAMGKVMGEYMARGAQLIREKLPEYMNMGREILSALGAGISENLPELMAGAEQILTVLLEGVEASAPVLGEAGLQIVMTLLEFLLAEAPQLLTAGLDLLTEVVNGLTEAMPRLTESAALIISTLLSYIISNAPGLLTAGVQLLTEVVNGISDNLPALIPQAIEAVTTLLQALIENAPQLLVAGVQLVLQIVQGLVENVPELLEAGKTLIGDLVFALIDAAAGLFGVGEEAVQQIKDGITGAWDALVSWFKGIWDSLFGHLSVNVGVNGSGGGPTSDHGFVGAGTYASGLDYVPYDMFPAYLHKGEAVLPAPQADTWRSGQGGGKTVNLYIYPQTLDETQMQMVVQVVNEELGKDVS